MTAGEAGELAGRRAQRFALGRTEMTRGAIELLAPESGDVYLASIEANHYLARHASGDWGEVDDHDKGVNEDAVQNGARILSAYSVRGGDKIWIITEWDRSVTTVLLPSEY
jgi:hypothetical protein